MTDASEKEAPQLGDPKDVGADAATASTGGDGPGGATNAGDDAEQTIDTPDELGGTGADEGGAG